MALALRANAGNTRRSPALRPRVFVLGTRATTLSAAPSRSARSSRAPSMRANAGTSTRAKHLLF